MRGDIYGNIKGRSVKSAPSVLISPTTCCSDLSPLHKRHSLSNKNLLYDESLMEILDYDSSPEAFQVDLGII